MTDLAEGFKYVMQLQIRFHDLDYYRHVNNARYGNYMEEARMAYARDVCGWDGTLTTLGLIIAHVSVDFRMPLFLGDALSIYVRTSRIGNKSFDMDYRFVATSPGRETVIAAEATTVMVTYDYAEEKTIPVYPSWRQAMRAYEPALQG
jgi:acyl-CoA thioester hydrolase